jgi:hypothetical protein
MPSIFLATVNAALDQFENACQGAKKRAWLTGASMTKKKV